MEFLFVSTIHVPDDVLVERRNKWTARNFPADHPRYLKTFCATVAQADQGCVSLAAFPEFEPIQ